MEGQYAGELLVLKQQQLTQVPRHAIRQQAAPTLYTNYCRGRHATLLDCAPLWHQLGLLGHNQMVAFIQTNIFIVTSFLNKNSN